jgi:drug/metabolite transporter superfamily protein YnfA
VERQAPTRADVLGAALAIAGALVIIGFAARVR